MFENTKLKNLILRTTKIRLQVLILVVIFVAGCTHEPNRDSEIIQFVYTSDSHFGINRATFQGDSNVNAQLVNEAMVKKINSLPGLILPNDNGVRAGRQVGGIDYLINTGDIANREEPGVQSARESWNQFVAVYVNGLTLKNKRNQKTEILLLPGNHDVSNTIGHYKLTSSITDNTSMVGIYNFMFPSHPITNSTYHYSINKIHYSKDIGGVHFVFIQMWPDSSERVWIENDLKPINDTIPVLMFTHDQPNVESKHFTNPNGNHDINANDKFENLIAEKFKDGTKITDFSVIEQRGFASFIKTHPGIKAYFHGNENENKYYEYKGPDNDIFLKVIQVDSPMKGNVSGIQNPSGAIETKLSFQLVSIDTRSKLMTVRECLWNADPFNPSSAIVWGENTTISLK
jgi:hypothetical protein